MLSAIVPCFQEGDGIARLEAELLPELAALGPHEIVAVDDGSTDETPARLRALAARSPEVRVHSHAFNRGLGAALRTGIAACRGEWVVAFDADLTFHPSSLGALVRAQRGSGADCVSGVPERVPSLPRRLTSLLANGLYRACFDRRPAAYTPMFRLYRGDLLRSLPLASEGFEISAEILVLLLRSGAKVVEVPVPLSARRTGRSKLRPLRETARHLALIARLIKA